MSPNNPTQTLGQSSSEIPLETLEIQRKKMGCCNFIGLVLSMMGGPLSLISTPLLKGFCIPGQGSGCFSICSASSAAEAGRVVVGRGNCIAK
ncbi:hypothetical protein RHGRI_025877 [Rhododendron griersonianum]|uniref:Uncharacterized protein n=1 Tax=Rhododendron griersonianum TaxID=479676 RepID=A0AAV6IVU8_9ERIC|nr:hypothetical protein RHGRI_025877 [Rhododendron griersonianum]